MAKRVQEIAKEQGLTAKELLERLHAAGVEVKAASSNVDEEVALRVLGNGQPATTEPSAPSDRGQEDRVGAAAGLQGLIGQSRPVGVDRSPPKGVLLELELAGRDGVQDLDRGRKDLRSDAVAGEQDHSQGHRRARLPAPG